MEPDFEPLPALFGIIMGVVLVLLLSYFAVGCAPKRHHVLNCTTTCTLANPPVCETVCVPE